MEVGSKLGVAAGDLILFGEGENLKLQGQSRNGESGRGRCSRSG